MKLMEIMLYNPVRSLFKEYFYFAKEIIDETIDESVLSKIIENMQFDEELYEKETILKVKEENLISYIDNICFLGETYGRIYLYTKYGKEHEVCYSEKFVKKLEEFEKRFEKINIKIPAIDIFLIEDVIRFDVLMPVYANMDIELFCKFYFPDGEYMSALHCLEFKNNQVFSI